MLPVTSVLETLIAAGVVATVGTLWKLTTEHASIKVSVDSGLQAVVAQLIGLRAELGKDIVRIEHVVTRIETMAHDHEFRIRKLEDVGEED